MIGNATGRPRCDNQVAKAALLLAKWLRLAAAPTFTIMALLTAVPDSGLSNALCSVAGGLRPSGMAPMYVLMAAFHLGPWLKLVSRPGNVALHS
jgi:hypothetical protein